MKAPPLKALALLLICLVIGVGASLALAGIGASKEASCRYIELFDGEIKNQEAYNKAYRVWSGEIGCEGRLKISVYGVSIPERWLIRVIGENGDSGWIAIGNSTKIFRVAPGDLEILIMRQADEYPAYLCPCLVENAHVKVILLP